LNLPNGDLFFVLSDFVRKKTIFVVRTLTTPLPMKENQEELTPKEKLDQENFLLKSKIITQGGIFSEESDIDPEIENAFLKNILAFEEAEYKVVNLEGGYSGFFGNM